MPTGFDPHLNFALAAVAVAPSPATSGSTLTVTTNLGAIFPNPVSAGSYNCTVFPTDSVPTTANAEVVRVTARAGDTFTILRAQEGSSARAIQVGDVIFLSITSKVIQDVEAAVVALQSSLATALNPYAFGVVNDQAGSTDQSVALHELADAAEALGGAAIVWPVGLRACCTTPFVHNTPVRWIGPYADISRFAAGSVAGVTPDATHALTELVWTGAANESQIFRWVSAYTGTETSPGVWTGAGSVWGGGMEGMIVHGGSLASRVVRASSCQHQRFVHNRFSRVRVAGIELDDDNANPLGVHPISYGNVIDDYHFAFGTQESCKAADAVRLGGAAASLNVTQTDIGTIAAAVYNGWALRLLGTDNNHAAKVHGVRQAEVIGWGAPTGGAVFFGSAGASYARNNDIGYVNGWIGGDGVNAHGNVIREWNNEASGYSAHASQTTSYNLIDRATGGMWRTHSFRMTDELHIPAASMNAWGAGGSAIQYLTQWDAIALANAANGFASCIVPPPYDWHNGTITGIRVYFGTSSAEAGVDVHLRCFVSTKQPTVTLGSVESDTTANITMPSGTNTGGTPYLFTLGGGLSYTRGDLLFIAIKREGSDAADTATGIFNLLGISVLYQASGPSEFGPFAAPAVPS